MFIILCLCSKANQNYKDFNGVNRQSSNGLKSKRQPSKKVLLYRQLSKKVSHISLLTWSSPTSGSWWKTQLVRPHVLKHAFSRHYKTLKLAYIRNFFEILKTADQENLVQKHKRYTNIYRS